MQLSGFAERKRRFPFPDKLAFHRTGFSKKWEKSLGGFVPAGSASAQGRVAKPGISIQRKTGCAGNLHPY